MCCLFGFYNYSGKPIKNLSELTNALAREATVRGTDATGIAYKHKGKIVIAKEGKSAEKINFKHHNGITALTGHTRHATQGSHLLNCNNHPFPGKCKNLSFALAHNGVLMNDYSLKKKYNLPKTKIKTDSYVAVQLLEYKKHLNSETIKFMAEELSGSFAFSILDSLNTMWLVRGDSPLALIHIPKYEIYIYASTEDILYKSLIDTPFFDEIKKGKTEEIPMRSGDILNFLPDGTIIHNKFNYSEYAGYESCKWWEFDMPPQSSYIDDIKAVAKYQGYSPDTIDELIKSGFTPEEIEEYIYCMD